MWRSTTTPPAVIEICVGACVCLMVSASASERERELVGFSRVPCERVNRAPPHALIRRCSGRPSCIVSAAGPKFRWLPPPLMFCFVHRLTRLAGPISSHAQALF